VSETRAMVTIRAGQSFWVGPLFSSRGDTSMAEDPAIAKRKLTL
jgi:hypothetical protein